MQFSSTLKNPWHTKAKCVVSLIQSDCSSHHKNCPSSLKSFLLTKILYSHRYSRRHCHRHCYRYRCRCCCFVVVVVMIICFIHLTSVSLFHIFAQRAYLYNFCSFVHLLEPFEHEAIVEFNIQAVVANI